MSAQRTRMRSLLVAMTFLAPNALGVLIFVVFPLLFSIMLAFTNWDLRLHNMFKSDPLQFVGVANFVRLLREGDFLRYLGNTLFLMMGIPFSIGGSLLAAILLSRDARAGGRAVWRRTLGATLLAVTVVMLAASLLGGSGMIILLVGTGCVVVVMGVLGGSTVYRTLFYCPHFTAGVATYLLWKKLYNPSSGPLNAMLDPALQALSNGVNTMPAGLWHGGSWLCVAAMALLLAYNASRLRRTWVDGELGSPAMLLPLALTLVPAALAVNWRQTHGPGLLLATAALTVLVWQATLVRRHGRDFVAPRWEGMGTALMRAGVIMVGQLILLGFVGVLRNLPAMAADGLQPPRWLADYHWAKPSIMIMGSGPPSGPTTCCSTWRR